MLREAVFYPAFAMVGLTFAVWLRMYAIRIAEMRRAGIHPQALAGSRQAMERLADTRASDNFRNLFELPVLFYLALVVAALLGLATDGFLALAWAFVGLRVVHSTIHCTCNKVMHRFLAYVAGSLVLTAMWVWLALRAA